MLGADPATTARQLAHESDLAGQSLWLGRFLAAALVGALAGAGPALLLIGAEFGNGSGTPWDSPYLYYPVFGALAYGLSLVLVATTLHISGDPDLRRSITSLAVTLPITTAAATAAGIITAANQNFETQPHVFITATLIVLIVFLAGCALARVVVIRQRRHHRSPPTVPAWELPITS